MSEIKYDTMLCPIYVGNTCDLIEDMIKVAYDLSEGISTYEYFKKDFLEELAELRRENTYEQRTDKEN